MLVTDLMAKLKKIEEANPGLEITILDGFNGGGQPRTINCGPAVFDPTDEDKTFENDEGQNYEDVETKQGRKIVVMGYGFY